MLFKPASIKMTNLASIIQSISKVSIVEQRYQCFPCRYHRRKVKQKSASMVSSTNVYLSPSSRLNHQQILFPTRTLPKLFTKTFKRTTPQNMTVWGRKHTVDGRTPLITAVVSSLIWTYIKLVFDAHKQVIHTKDDVMTGLTVCISVAVGLSSDLESAHRLCMEHPPMLIISLIGQDDEFGSSVSVDAN